MLVAIFAALASAFCFALAAALQHREALRVECGGVADVRLLLKLCRRPLWLTGVAADLGSMTLHVLALSFGTLSLVQPLGVTGILFAIPLAALLRGQRIRRLDILAAAAVALGLIVLLKSLPTSSGHSLPSAELVLWVVLGALAFVALMTAIARVAPGRPRAILLAVAAGTSFGLTAVLVRTLMVSMRHHASAGAIVTTSIAVAVVGLVGYLLLQSAYRSGHFAGTVATMTVLNPLVAVLAGGVLLHEGMPTGMVHLISIAIAAAVICTGIALLVRSPAIVLSPPAEHRAPAEQVLALA